MPTSYSRGPWFKSQPVELLTLLQFFTVLFGPFRHMQKFYLKISHVPFLPHIFILIMLMHQEINKKLQNPYKLRKIFKLAICADNFDQPIQLKWLHANLQVQGYWVSSLLRLLIHNEVSRRSNLLFKVLYSVLQ